LHDHPAPQHAHPAGELVAPRLLGSELHHGLLERRQELPDSERRKHDLLRAARRLLPIEDQPHGRPPPHPYPSRRICPLDPDADLLYSAGERRWRRAPPTRDEEVPVDPDDRGRRPEYDQYFTTAHRSSPTPATPYPAPTTALLRSSRV